MRTAPPSPVSTPCSKPPGNTSYRLAAMVKMDVEIDALVPGIAGASGKTLKDAGSLDAGALRCPLLYPHIQALPPASWATLIF